MSEEKPVYVGELSLSPMAEATSLVYNGTYPPPVWGGLTAWERVTDESNLLGFILRVLRIFSEIDCTDALWWRLDGEYAPVTFLVNCNDFFDWAAADCERLTPDNVETLERAVADCRANGLMASVYAADLFCARVRGQRPQKPCYKDMEPAAVALFNACGPERED